MDNFISLDHKLIQVEVQANSSHFCIICKAEFQSRHERNEHLETHFVHKNCQHCSRPVIVIGDLEFELHRPTHCTHAKSELTNDEELPFNEVQVEPIEVKIPDISEDIDADTEERIRVASSRRIKEPVNYVEINDIDYRSTVKAVPQRRAKRATIARSKLLYKTELIHIDADITDDTSAIVPNTKSDASGSEHDDVLVKEMDVAMRKRRRYPRLPKTVPCTQCDAKFGTERTLKIHMGQVHGIKDKLICPICSREFKVAGNLKQHIDTHSDYKRFICNYCGKGFHLPYNLKEHMNTHTGARPYKCDTCGKTFGRNTLRQAHMRIHTGEKPYKCTAESCDRAYAYQTDLKRHRRSVHGIITKTFPCPICNKMFYENKFLTKHLGIHHANVRE